MKKILGILLGFTMVCMFAASANADLVAHWCFDDDLNPGLDCSGNGHHGTVYGTTWVDGALSFPGNTTTDYVEVPPVVMDGLDDFTVSIMFKCNDVSAEHNSLLSAANNAMHQANELLLLVFGGKIAFIRGPTEIEGQTSISNDTWYHYVIRRETNTSLNKSTIKMFLDLKEDYSYSEHWNDPLVVGGLVIGQDQDEEGGGFLASQAWRGLIDEIRVYDTALTETEICQLHHDPVTEIPNNGIDDDCDGRIDEMWDLATVEISQETVRRSNALNKVVFLFIPVGAVIFLRILHRKR